MSMEPGVVLEAPLAVTPKLGRGAASLRFTLYPPCLRSSLSHFPTDTCIVAAAVAVAGGQGRRGNPVVLLMQLIVPCGSWTPNQHAHTAFSCSACWCVSAAAAYLCWLCTQDHTLCHGPCSPRKARVAGSKLSTRGQHLDWTHDLRLLMQLLSSTEPASY